MTENPATWNKEPICDGELRDLLQRVDEICTREKLPYLFAVAYKNEPDAGDSKTGYIMSIAPGPDDISDPRLRAAMALIRGESPLVALASLMNLLPEQRPEPSLN